MEDEEFREGLKKQIAEVIAAGPFADTWESLTEYRPAKWFCDSKFGIFIHWGVYSVPAFSNEWYPRNMYTQGTPEFAHHVKTYGPQKDFGYKDFIPMFRAEKFNAAEWAELFKEAGARFVVPVAEHHDGFQMYASRLSGWNAAEMGPHRDLIGEEEKAYRDAGLLFGCSSHRIEHWFFLGHGREFDSDLKEQDEKQPLHRGDLYWPSVDLPDAQIASLRSEPRITDEFMEDWLLRS